MFIEDSGSVRASMLLFNTNTLLRLGIITEAAWALARPE